MILSVDNSNYLRYSTENKQNNMNQRPRKPRVGNERGIRRSIECDTGIILNKYNTVRIKCPILFIDELFMLGQKDG